MKDSLSEIETHWSFMDLVNAHRMLDAYDEAETEHERRRKVKHGTS